MEKLFIRTEMCKSCGYCVRACPKKALNMSGSLNKNGYEYVSVNEALCILCGSCYTVCPDLVFEIREVCG